jgi:hypothetical protein
LEHTNAVSKRLRSAAHVHNNAFLSLLDDGSDLTFADDDSRALEDQQDGQHSSVQMASGDEIAVMNLESNDIASHKAPSASAADDLDIDASNDSQKVAETVDEENDSSSPSDSHFETSTSADSQLSSASSDSSSTESSSKSSSSLSPSLLHRIPSLSSAVEHLCADTFVQELDLIAFKIRDLIRASKGSSIVSSELFVFAWFAFRFF